MAEVGPSAADAVETLSGQLLGVALEGIEQGAAEAGLPRELARAFVRQTALGTALLLEEHPGSPADLKDQVASPGGTTIAGLAVLEDRGVRGAFIRAVETAADRGRALSSAPSARADEGTGRAISEGDGQAGPSEGREK